MAESDGTIAVTVQLERPAVGPMTVDYAPAGGTAGAADRTLAPGTLTFAAGETSKEIDVGITQDALDEPAETIVIALSNPGNTALGTTATHTLTITDDDATVGFAGAASAKSEGAGTVTVSVGATGGISGTVTVDYSVAGGSATLGVDYTLAGGTLTLTPGAPTKTIPIGIVQDSVVEPDETIVIELSNVTGQAEIGVGKHTLTVVDDEVTVGFASRGSRKVETAGSAGVAVTLSGAATGKVTVRYAATGGTATNGKDYTLAAGTLTFTSGQVKKTLPLTLKQDFFVEPGEAVVVKLSSPSGAKLGTSTHTLTITDDEPHNQKCGGRSATIVGTNGADILNGTSGGDVIVGRGGKDTLNGKGGGDILCGAGGADTLKGQGGRDRLSGGPGAGDRCDGGPATDSLLAGHGCETAAGVP